MPNVIPRVISSGPICTFYGQSGILETTTNHYDDDEIDDDNFIKRPSFHLSTSCQACTIIITTAITAFQLKLR